MSAIPPWDYPRFEKWVIENYPRTFERWELDASDMIDLDDWLEREKYLIIREWRKSHPQQKPRSTA